MEGTISAAELRLARLALQRALQMGAQKARVTLDKSQMDMVNTLNGEVDKVTRCLDLCLTVNVFVDGRYGSFSTNKVREDSLDEFIRRGIETARMLSEDACRDLPDAERTVKTALTGREMLNCDEASYAAMTPQRRLEIAREASIWAGPSRYPSRPKFKYISEEAEYSDTVEDSVILDSNGLECRHTETSFDYAVEVTVEDARGAKYSAFWWDASPRLADLKWQDCCETALQKAVAQIRPRKVPGGKYNMVIDTEVASKVVSPLLRALSAYSVQQNNSFLTGSVGQKVFPEGLTLVDDPLIPGDPGSKLFDSEGVAAARTSVIEAGVVKEYFVNTYMSHKMDIAPTLEDALRPKVLGWPRAGLDREAIMEMCGEGILVTDFNGGNSNSSTGDFSFGVEGFLFRDGKIVCPVREMLVTGNFLTLWQGLIACGDDARGCMSKLIPTLAFANVDFSA